MLATRTQKEKLVEEFHVQVFSNGRVDWDRLDSFIPSWAINRIDLEAYLKENFSVELPAHR